MGVLATMPKTVDVSKGLRRPTLRLYATRSFVISVSVRTRDNLGHAILPLFRTVDKSSK
jgi:hypothetical protein